METQFAEDFRKLIGQEGDAAIGALRERAFEYFAANGFPTPKHEQTIELRIRLAELLVEAIVHAFGQAVEALLEPFDALELRGLAAAGHGQRPVGAGVAPSGQPLNAS